MSDILNSALGYILHFLYLIVFTLTYPIRILSDVSLPSSISTSLSTASGYLHALNSFLPIDTMLEILGVVLAFEAGYLFYKLVMWVIKKIPTIS